MMRFGYTQTCITPNLEQTVYLAGFARNRVAQSVHDDLWARAIALITETTTLVLITVDVIGLPRTICQAIEKAVQEKAGETVQLLIVCSHTHFGPDTIGLWGASSTESGVDPIYMATLQDHIQQVALDALSTASEVVSAIKSTEVTVPHVARNARNPDRVDEEATCLQFLSDDRILATCVIYPCHPEVLDPTTTELSSDYVHTLRTAVEAETGSPALFMPGALGGMMTPAMPGKTHNDATEMGKIIAKTVLNTLNTAIASTMETFAYNRQAIRVEFDSPMLEQIIEAGILQLGGLDANGQVLTEINLLQFNKTVFITNPGELFPELGLELKHYMKSAGAQIAGVVSLANDEIGYILPEEDYIYPENPLVPSDHYEETVSLGPKVGTALMQASQRLIDTQQFR